MKRRCIIWWITLFINSYLIKAQEITPVDKWMEYIEDLAVETENTEQIETLYNELSYLSEHPFNLNTATEKQLRKLPFLSDQQIKGLLIYRRKYGDMVSIYELKGIKEMNKQTIDFLLPFIYVSPGKEEMKRLNIRNIIKYGKNELALRYDQCLETKKGYQQVSDSLLTDSPNKKYVGERFYHSLRYSFIFEENIKMGMVAEKDAGEPFFKTSHKGYDYYSAHFLLQDVGLLKSLAIGDYKASFGQGLVLSYDFTPGRSALITQVERRNNGFRRHYSTNENDFFRGLATTLSIKKVDFSLFYSRRKLDGIVEENEIRSFKTDGLHRIIKDYEKAKTIKMQTLGGNIRYASSNVCIGLTTVYYSFGNKTVRPLSKPYNLFYFRGNENINLGVDYLFKWNKLKFFGETALSKNKAVATLNALQLTPMSYLSFLILFRSYSRKYHSYFGNAFAQNTMVQNEQGLYTSLEFTPFSQWKLALYGDIFRFPWLKYGVDFPSAGKEYMVQAEYSGNKNFTTSFRYKYKNKETNDQQRMRVQFAWNGSTSFNLKTSVESVIYKKNKDNRSIGWMISQNMGYKCSSFPVQLDGYIAYFNTNDYWSRMSSYEKNILYAFSMPSCYGKGIRLAASFKLELVKNLSLSAKFACTDYFDREVISSGLEEIQGHVKTDIYTLVRWKF